MCSAPGCWAISRTPTATPMLEPAELRRQLTLWASCSLTSSPGAAGDTHHKALRALSNRWVGIHHGCLRHRSTYDEATAWNHLTENFAAAA